MPFVSGFIALYLLETEYAGGGYCNQILIPQSTIRCTVFGLNKPFMITLILNEFSSRSIEVWIKDWSCAKDREKQIYHKTNYGMSVSHFSGFWNFVAISILRLIMFFIYANSFFWYSFILVETMCSFIKITLGYGTKIGEWTYRTLKLLQG